MTENGLKTLTFNVQMKCKSCINKLSAVLEELKDEGVEEYNFNFDEQTVKVKTSLPPEEIVTAMKAIGKELTLISNS